MIAALRISSMLALVLASVLLVMAGIGWVNEASGTAQAAIPCVADRLANTAGDGELSFSASPLIAQAQALADHLNPPQSLESVMASTDIPSARSSPAPRDPPAKLTLHATSCYPHQPGRSMALVSSGDGSPQDQRWVREGAQFGSFVIHEVRRGGVTYREGDVLYEATVQRSENPRSLVRDLRGDPQHVSATRELPAPAGSNDVAITDN